MKSLIASELVLNDDGSVYHLKLLPHQISENIILVGDQDRVESVSSFFDSIEHHNRNREYSNCTGLYKGKRITVLSTGIGTDNIDIALNELDALVNIDLETRSPKSSHTSLNLIRIGTSGTLVNDIPLKSFVLSSYAIGLDGLMHFYDYQENEEEKLLLKKINRSLDLPSNINKPYLVKADESLARKLGEGFYSGITATAPGFYGPQGRELRIKPFLYDINERLSSFQENDLRIVNFEMETSALYGLSGMLGHKACTVCLIIANRPQGVFLNDYKPSMDILIKTVLDRLNA